jgi:hypothetical protein
MILRKDFLFPTKPLYRSLSNSTNPLKDSQFRSRHLAPTAECIYTGYSLSRPDVVCPDRMQAIPIDTLYPDRMLAIRGVLVGLYS